MNVDRRLFLFGSALAAHAFQPEESVNTAMIGTGNRGSFLLQGVLRQPNAKVLALCDIKPDRLDKAATAAVKDNPSTYADWQKVIERKDVDAVFIATPPYLHSEMAIQAIQAGKTTALVYNGGTEQRGPQNVNGGHTLIARDRKSVV